MYRISIIFAFVFFFTTTLNSQSKDQALQQLRDDGISFTGEIFLENIKDGEEDIVRLFIIAGIDIEQEYTYITWHKASPLEHAIYFKEYSIARLLLDNGANPNIYISANRTLLEDCVSRENDMIEYLISSGADVNFGRNNCLSIAIYRENEDMINLFLEKGIDVNKSDKNGVTPLMMAAQYDNLDVFKVLLSKGADIKAVDKYYLDVLMYAQIGRKGPSVNYVADDIIDYLIELGYEPIEGVNSDKEDRREYYYEYLFSGRIKKALPLIRLMAKNSSGDEKAAMHNNAITCLSQYTMIYGFKLDYLEEAEYHYNKIIELFDMGVGDKKRQEEILLYSKLGMIQIYSYYAYADAFFMMESFQTKVEEYGDLTLKRLFYQTKAMIYNRIGNAEEFFYNYKKVFKYHNEMMAKEDFREVEENWEHYSNILIEYIESIVNLKPDDGLNRINQSLSVIERAIDEDLLDHRFYYYKALAGSYIIFGDSINSDKYLKLAKEHGPEDAKTNNFSDEMYDYEIHLKEVEGRIDFIKGKYSNILNNYFELVDLLNSEGMRKNSPYLFPIISHTYEYLNEPAKAFYYNNKYIDYMENIRDVVDINNRIKFYQSSGIYAQYAQGLRILIKSFIMKSKEETINSILEYFDKIHSRSLIEIRNERDKTVLPTNQSTYNLKNIQERLNNDDVLIAYSVLPHLYDVKIAEVARILITKDHFSVDMLKSNYNEISQVVSPAIRQIANNEILDQESLILLSDLLFDSIKKYLINKNLFFISDGIMTRIPFEILPIDNVEGASLIDYNNVSYLPSISWIQNNTQKSKYGKLDFLGVGDPDYKGINIILKKGSHNSGYKKFVSLPETRNEILSIQKFIGSNNSEVLLGKMASENRIKSLQLNRFKILHFATHGVTGEILPNTDEPALVLTVDSHNDGFLTSSEIRKLNLESDIVVLSACNTGTGEIVSGEGMMGLGRAFLEAGSNSVIVSLWPVDSKTTEMLMIDFYRNLKNGLSKIESLRKAKQNLRDINYYQLSNDLAFRGFKKKNAKISSSGALHPYYWAPFILIGDYGYSSINENDFDEYKEKKDNVSKTRNTVRDIDGNLYETIKIGDQIWMAENLRATRYNNGDSIPVINNKNSWPELKSGACNNYDNNERYSNAYGILYNGYATTDKRGLAPEGWHIPSVEEWKELIQYIGGRNSGGSLKFPGIVYWNSSEGATNSSGFSALPGGQVEEYDGELNSIGEEAVFWSDKAFYILDHYSPKIQYWEHVHQRNPLLGRSFYSGASIRCIKDN